MSLIQEILTVTGMAVSILFITSLLLGLILFIRVLVEDD